MPLVQLRYNTDGIALLTLRNIAGAFRAGVADALTCSDPDGQVTTEDIEIHFVANGPYDISDFVVIADIEAYDFPTRVVNKDARASEIGIALEGLLGPNPPKLAVWLKLVNAAWWSGTG